MRHARWLGVEREHDDVVRLRGMSDHGVALTDVTTWRALRDDGASPAASVEKASVAVERWLEARPARA